MMRRRWRTRSRLHRGAAAGPSRSVATTQHAGRRQAGRQADVSSQMYFIIIPGDRRYSRTPKVATTSYSITHRGGPTTAPQATPSWWLVVQQPPIMAARAPQRGRRWAMGPGGRSALRLLAATSGTILAVCVSSPHGGGSGSTNCNWVVGRDFLAAGDPPQNASTREECCEICRNTPACVAGVWCPPTPGGRSCGLTTGRCYTKFSMSTPRNTSSSVIACVIPPTPGVLAPPKLGDAVVMGNCSRADPLASMRWALCAGSACFAPGAFGVTPSRTSIRSPGGLCLDAAGGFPGWRARVMPCDTTFDSQVWGNNPITSTTWRLGADGTLRTNISKAGSPRNASGEACLFSSVPAGGGDRANSDWWTSEQVGMWWCEGAPPESRWAFNQAAGQLTATAGPKKGLCLGSTDERLPTPQPPVPTDPVRCGGRCVPFRRPF
jgi:hypothetical protein